MQLQDVSTAIGLGSNMGEPTANLITAVEQLRQGGLRDITLAPFYETEPVDCVPGTPLFTNTACTGCWSEPVEALSALCAGIERQLGRPEFHSSREARIIDLDLLLFDQEIIFRPELRIPHHGLAERLFVLAPLKDIAPDWMVPGANKTVLELYKQLLQQPQSHGAVRQLPSAESGWDE